MNKLAIIPIFFLTMCGTAPVVDPPAHACSPRLDGGFTICPNPDDPFPKPKPKIPRQELKGEIDIYNPMHWHQMQTMFQRNARREQIEKNEGYCRGANDYLNRTFDVLDEFWQ